MKQVEAASSDGRALARWATLAIVVVAIIRCLTPVLPQVRFDTDPASNPAAFTGLGPAASFMLDAILLAASALALIAERRNGRGVQGWLVLCGLVPGISVLWWGLADAAHFFRGATWLAAAMALVATAHLARDPVMRRLIVAGCLAVTIPLALRGFEQIFIDHARTVEDFEKTKTEFFANRGWEIDSPAAQMFTRRLGQLEATGWFGLANIYSAMMAFGTLAFGGMGIAAMKRRDPRGSLALIAALMCVALLAVNGSKGSIAAGLLGAAAGAVAILRPRLAPALALGVIALAACAPALRGLFSESFANEKSLLFRFQYLQGAWGALPEALPFGLGPDGFQNAYLRLKPPRSPEDVVSTHAMIVDWIVLLGPLGIAWIALVGRGFVGGEPSTVSDDDEPIALRAGIIATACVLCAQSISERSLADLEWLALRGLGAAVLLGAFVLADALQRVLSPAVVRAALLAAVVAVFAQAQVEMILFWPGTVVWAMVALGAITRVPVRDPNPRVTWISAAASATFALAILLYGFAPQLRQDRLLDQAANTVASIYWLREAWPDARQEIAAGKSGLATTKLLDVIKDCDDVEMLAAVTAATKSTDARGPVAMTMQALQRFDAGQRAKAAEILDRADEAYPENATALDAAVKQLAVAGRRTLGQRLNAIVDGFLHDEAIKRALKGAQRFGGAKFPARLADLWVERARATQDAQTLSNGTIALRVALERQPRMARMHVDLGDFLAAQGDLAGALDSYRSALEINKDLELDVMAQFSERQRKEVESRIERVVKAQQGEALPAGWPFAQ